MSCQVFLMAWNISLFFTMKARASSEHCLLIHTVLCLARGIRFGSSTRLAYAIWPMINLLLPTPQKNKKKLPWAFGPRCEPEIMDFFLGLPLGQYSYTISLQQPQHSGFGVWFERMVVKAQMKKWVSCR
jgi:hypothetical protein